tara:strand:+ start:852 stop:1913 length:1062 start_codon:yes stop_codon:yes gene_type:complete
MEKGYLNYSSLMSSAIQDATRKASQGKQIFEGKLAKVGAEKSEVENLTNIAVMPFEAKVAKVGITGISRGIDKISGGKVTELNEFINKKIGRVKTNAGKQLGKLKDKLKSKEEPTEEPTEETSEAPSGQSSEIAPKPVETAPTPAEVPAEVPEALPESTMSSAFETGRPIIEDMTPNESFMTRLIAGGEQQAQTQAQADALPSFPGLRDSMAPMRDEMMAKATSTNTDMANGQASSETVTNTTSTQADAAASAGNNAGNSVGTQAGENVGTQAGENVAKDVGTQVGEDIIPEALADTTIDAVGGALMDNPFTFFIGLAMMVGGIVGGVEGSRSIKNPTPKAVAVPNVSTQFGL